MKEPVCEQCETLHCHRPEMDPNFGLVLVYVHGAGGPDSMAKGDSYVENWFIIRFRMVKAHVSRVSYQSSDARYSRTCYLLDGNIKVLHFWAWVASENRYWSYKVKGAWREEAIYAIFLWARCEPGSIMRLKLASGSCPEKKSSNFPHQSKIKDFNNQWDCWSHHAHLLSKQATRYWSTWSTCTNIVGNGRCMLWVRVKSLAHIAVRVAYTQM